MSYWKRVFAIAKQYCPDYGTKPNKPVHDEKWFMKRQNAIDDTKNPLSPHTNINHYMWCALENLIYEFNTHGYIEPTSVKAEDF